MIGVVHNNSNRDYGFNIRIMILRNWDFLKLFLHFYREEVQYDETRISCCFYIFFKILCFVLCGSTTKWQNTILGCKKWLRIKFNMIFGKFRG